MKLAVHSLPWPCFDFKIKMTCPRGNMQVSLYFEKVTRHYENPLCDYYRNRKSCDCHTWIAANVWTSRSVRVANVPSDQGHDHCGNLETAFLTIMLQKWWKEASVLGTVLGKSFVFEIQKSETEKASTVFHRNWEKYWAQ